MTDDELRSWAVAYAPTYTQAAAVLRLLAERDALLAELAELRQAACVPGPHPTATGVRSG